MRGKTFGALFAAWYARTAADAELRAAMIAFAPDELRHAALGWDIGAWDDQKLEARARARVRAARKRAVAKVGRGSRRDPKTHDLVSAMVKAGLWTRS